MIILTKALFKHNNHQLGPSLDRHNAMHIYILRTIYTLSLHNIARQSQTVMASFIE